MTCGQIISLETYVLKKYLLNKLQYLYHCELL